MSTARTITIQLLIVILGAAFQLALSDRAAAGEITQRELLQRLDMNDAPFIIDVRRADEFAAGHVPGAVNIPHDEIVAHLDELRDRQNSEVVVYCESGKRAAIAQSILEKAGFTRVKHLQGDMRSWRERRLPHVQPNSPTAPARK